MTDKQPEALWLANFLQEKYIIHGYTNLDKAAAELRRLHEENEMLRKRLDEAIDDLKAFVVRPALAALAKAQGDNNG